MYYLSLHVFISPPSVFQDFDMSVEELSEVLLQIKVLYEFILFFCVYLYAALNKFIRLPVIKAREPSINIQCFKSFFIFLSFSVSSPHPFITLNWNKEYQTELTDLDPNLSQHTGVFLRSQI